MDCFLHIGLQKCGSTSLQAWGAANRELLKNVGVLFPSSLSNNNRYAHNRFVSICSQFHRESDFSIDTGAKTASEFETWKKGAIAEFKTELQTAKEQGIERVFISHENLSKLDKDSIAFASEFLEEMFDRVFVFGYLRPPVSLVQSWISTRAKNGRGDFEPFLSGFSAQIDKSIQNWSGFGSKVEWHSLTKVRDTINHACQLLEVDRTTDFETPNENVSLSAKSVELLGHLSLPRKQSGRRNRFRKTYLEELPSGVKPKLSRSQAKAIQNRHTEEIARIMELCPHLTEDDLLVDVSKYPEHANFGTAPPTYVDELKYVVTRLNAEVAYQKVRAELASADLHIKETAPLKAKRCLARANAFLVDLQNSDLDSLSAPTKPLEKRLNRLKTHLAKL